MCLPGRLQDNGEPLDEHVDTARLVDEVDCPVVKGRVLIVDLGLSCQEHHGDIDAGLSQPEQQFDPRQSRKRPIEQQDVRFRCDIQ